MRLVPLLFVVTLVSAGVGIGVALRSSQAPKPALPLVVGKYITPIGEQNEVGSYPINFALSPDGRFAVSTNAGFRQYLTVFDASTGKPVGSINVGPEKGRKKDEGLYFGIAFGEKQGLDRMLYASRGAEDIIGVYRIKPTGEVLLDREIAWPASGRKIPWTIAGLAGTPEMKQVLAVFNQSHQGNGQRGSLAFIDAQSGALQGTVKVGGFPLNVCVSRDGSLAFVGNERDGTVSVVDIANKKLRTTLRTGAAPTGMGLSPDGRALFVANSNSDTISKIDIPTLKVVGTVLLRPNALRGLPGSTPQGLAVSKDGTRLLAAMSDMNAVAVIDLERFRLEGFFPTGWLPTAVCSLPSGDVLVASAKGVQVRNPNGADVRTWGKYAPNIIEGTVAHVNLDEALAALGAHTEQVIANNRAVAGLDRATHPDFVNPGIEHVIYIIKENRTYDQVLGDVPKGNGDPSLCLFGKEITPNQHALVERFALLDNFYVCAEVSADGWNWSTAGMVSPYVSRNSVTNYSGRGRAYDFEGLNNGERVEFIGSNDVARPAGGYLWDLALKHGVSVRNYGFFSSSGEKRNDAEMTDADDNQPTKKALVGISDENFRRYDLSYADSDAWVSHGVSAPVQKKAFGKFGATSRFAAWKREFDQFVANGKLPKLSLVRFGNDHTWGTAAGRFSPRAMVADNDYAVAQLVEAVSKSPYWKKTAIMVLEDDAQAGYDHVDAHRSTAYVISPFVPKGTVYSAFGNTDSMLRTIELLLGMPPMNQYDAVAPPFKVFGKQPLNDAPFKAMLPPKEIVCEINQKSAYRSADSLALIDPLEEESLPDIELNDILWGHMRGAKTPRPPVINGSVGSGDRD